MRLASPVIDPISRYSRAGSVLFCDCQVMPALSLSGEATQLSQITTTLRCSGKTRMRSSHRETNTTGMLLSWRSGRGDKPDLAGVPFTATE